MDIRSKSPIPLSHWPSLFLIIGYPVFWLDLCFNRNGHGQTTLLAWGIFFIAGLWQCWRYQVWNKEDIRGLVDYWQAQTLLMKGFLFFITVLCLMILLIGFYASLLPPHLIQESDVMNYHLTVPRQHLIVHSFDFIPWSADDLFLLPIDFSLAPFWLATPLPNKFPQFVFFLGLLGITIRLAVILKKKDPWTAGLLVFWAVLGSHGLGIQMGTGMVDLIVPYLFFAVCDSLLRQHAFLFVTELAFLFCSKPLAPVQLLIFIGLFSIVYLLLTRIFGFKVEKIGFDDLVSWDRKSSYKKFVRTNLGLFFLLVVLLAGPFVIKSIYYSGSPLFPIAPGTLNIHHHLNPSARGFGSILRASHYLCQSIQQDKYGGRSWLDFIRHFWILAVPTQGVNNPFDYPMGLPYLLYLFPFLYTFMKSLRAREFVWLPWMAVIYWVLWWFGSNEARFLYTSVMIIFMTMSVHFNRPSWSLKIGLLIALIMNFGSLYRAHHGDWGVSPRKVLRVKDQNLLKLNTIYIQHHNTNFIDLSFADAAFAQFPVIVRQEKLPHTIAF